MRIVCVGGGPAGLYFAISAKLRDPRNEITVLDRAPFGSTHGWGVVYWEPLLDILYRNDQASAREIRAASTLWQEQRLTVGERAAYLPGYGYSIQRTRLLGLLTRRARDLGVHLQDRHELAGLDELTELAGRADLVVAADGVHSRVRQLLNEREDVFGTRLEHGANQFIWLGTSARFTNFVFAFEPTPAGWIWIHAYPSAAAIGTCIVECAPRTWTGLELDRLEDDTALARLESIFARPLGGERLISGGPGQAPARWQRFEHVTNRAWSQENVVLIGDAAHTTHFTLGSGTALAMMDAVMLARFLRQHDNDVPAALAEFDESGRAALGPIQRKACVSMAWFERVDEVLAAGQDPMVFSLAMASRQGELISPVIRGMLRANQVPAVRRLAREAGSGARWLLDRRRSREITHAA
jgi:2-polyprenyl-6-methoxyphenol hydroxylase-like FAD-dependent oxidoreductase